LLNGEPQDGSTRVRSIGGSHYLLKKMLLDSLRAAGGATIDMRIDEVINVQSAAVGVPD
jgi:hypothetical protein